MERFLKNEKKYSEGTYEYISPKLAAVNNKVRFSILEILSELEQENNVNCFKKEPLYSREINTILSEAYGITITPQMLGQHLKQLANAQLIEEINLKKEVPNKIGPRTVKAYKIMTDSLKDLFLDINFLTNELSSLFVAYETNKKQKETGYIVLTILSGIDRGKTFKIGENEELTIKRRTSEKKSKIRTLDITLNKKQFKDSDTENHVLKIFFEGKYWHVLDKNRSDDIFIGNMYVHKNKITKLKNNSFIRIGRGVNGFVFYCSY